MSIVNPPSARRAVIIGDRQVDRTGVMYESAFARRGISSSWISMPEILGLIASVDGRSLLEDSRRNPYAVGEHASWFSLPADHEMFEPGVIAVIDSDDYGPYAPIIAHCLAAMGVVLFNNPTSLRLANDKWATHRLWRDAGLPMPKACLVKSQDEVDAAISELGFPIVVKELQGTKGFGVRLAHDEAELRECVDSLELNRQPLLFEHYIECGSADRRVVTVRNTFVSAMTRHAAEGDFRANISLGGVGERCVISEEDLTIIRRATDLLGLRLVGMDLGTVTEVLPGREYLPLGSSFLIEANPMPGLSGLQQATHVDATEFIVDELLDELFAVERPVA